MRYSVISVIVAITLTLSLDICFARGFVTKSGELRISELGKFTITRQVQNSEKNRKNHVLLQLSTKDGQNSARFEIYDVNGFDVFDQKILKRFIDALRRKGDAIVTVKPVTWDGRRYQCIFLTRLAKIGGKPAIVFVQQFVLVHKGRFHNITFGSSRDQPETNPVFIELLKHTRIRK